MRELTITDLDAELLPARELMGCAARGRSSFSYTNVQGSGDGDNDGGFISVLNGSLDGDDIVL